MNEELLSMLPLELLRGGPPEGRMPKRELTEMEKSLRLEQVVERKMLAAAMRLKDQASRSCVAQRVTP